MNPAWLLSISVLSIALAAGPAAAQTLPDDWPLPQGDSAAIPAERPAVRAADTAASGNREAVADPFARFMIRWLPANLRLGPQGGVQASRLRATTDYRRLIEPTPSEGAWRSYSYGVALMASWRNGMSLTVAPRRETYGLSTRERTVSFSGNPFPHSLESRTELAYNLWPMLIGWGVGSGRQRVHAQAGAYMAYLDHGETVWTIDGEPSSRRPYVEFKSKVPGWIAALEYGVRFGRGEFVFGLESHRAVRSAMAGMEGSIRHEAAQARLSYLWLLGER